MEIFRDYRPTLKQESVLKRATRFIRAGAAAVMLVAEAMPALAAGNSAGYPKCDIPANPTHTVWVGEKDTYDLKELPGQCTNPQGSNDIYVSRVLSRAQAIGNTAYSDWDIPLACPPWAVGFSLRREQGEPGTGFNGVTGGLKPGQPALDNLYITNVDRLPNGIYSGSVILGCQTPEGEVVSLRRIHWTTYLGN